LTIKCGRTLARQPAEMVMFLIESEELE